MRGDSGSKNRAEHRAMRVDAARNAGRETLHGNGKKICRSSRTSQREDQGQSIEAEFALRAGAANETKKYERASISSWRPVHRGGGGGGNRKRLYWVEMGEEDGRLVTIGLKRAVNF